MNRVLSLVAAGMVIGAAGGCNEAPVSPDSPLGRTLTLARYDGKGLPVDLMPVPPAPHTGTYDPSCQIQVRDGTLEIHIREGLYALRVNAYDSCQNYLLPGLTPDLAGPVTQQGATLKLDIDGRGVAFLEATIQSNAVVVMYGGKRLEFR